jgi:hypothetical protein
MNNSYFSFLICSHPNIINVYYIGTHIGSIHNNLFKTCKLKRANGEETDITIQDLQNCEFDSIESLKSYLFEVIAKINLAGKT